MRIKVDKQALEYFWEKIPCDDDEFWAFQYPPKAIIGGEILFSSDGETIAKAVVSAIEPPGASACSKTCRFKKHWKVFWKKETFVDLRGEEGAKLQEVSLEGSSE